MPSLQTAGSRFNSPFRTETGINFEGILQPIEDGKIYSDDYNYVRQIMRVAIGEPVKAGDVVQAIDGRRYLLGSLDVGFNASEQLYTGFQMYPCNVQLQWKREASILDPLTKLAKSTGAQELGVLWSLQEVLNREASSQNIKAKEEVRRTILGVEVLLGDTLNGMVIRKVQASHGLWIAEVQ